jgi:hypothetical protein
MTNKVFSVEIEAFTQMELEKFSTFFQDNLIVFKIEAEFPFHQRPKILKKNGKSTT